jgi:hypothetical protein
MTDQTLFQQLVDNDEVPQMIEDLENIDWNEADAIEVAISFTEDKMPRVLEELEELVDDGE